VSYDPGVEGELSVVTKTLRRANLDRTFVYSTHEYDRDDSIPDDQAAPHIDPADPEICSSSTTSSRAIVYHYALQEALWHQLWLVNAPTQFPGASTDPRSFNVGERLELARRDRVKVPPVFLTSGTADDKVDPAGAERLASRLGSLGCDHVWDERQGCDHLFDQDENERMERMHEFLQRHLL
jgi:hypothetical protein